MRNLLLYLGISAAITSIISLVFGAGTINSSSIIMFTLLSLVIPIVLKVHPRGKELFTFSFSYGLYVYSWLGWSLFFYVGNAIVPIDLPSGGAILIALVWLIAMMVSTVCMIVTALILTKFFEREKRWGIIEEVLDVAVYTLPIPMMLLGDVFFERLEGLQLVPQVSHMLLTFISLIIYALVLITMLVLVAYLYPRNGVRKAPRFTRIIVTAIMWLAINGHIVFGGYIPPWVIPIMEAALPVFQGSILVYITPAIIELGVLTLSMIIGYGIERLWISKSKEHS